MGASASRKPSENLLRILAAVVGLVGLAIAGYIMIEQIQDKVPVCGRGGGCETVLTSEYAELFGIPLYYFGVVGYISILGATLVAGDRGRLAAFVLSFFGFGVSAYLTFLQYVVIDSICVWCRGSAIAMAVLFLLCLTRLLMYYGTDFDLEDDRDSDLEGEPPETTPPGDPAADQPT